MTKLRYLGADGKVSVDDVFAASARANASNSGTDDNGVTEKGSSWWNRLIDIAPSTLSTIKDTITGSISAKTGNYAPVANEDNTPKVLAIAGVAALVLIVIVLIVVFAKRK